MGGCASKPKDSDSRQEPLLPPGPDKQPKADHTNNNNNIIEYQSDSKPETNGLDDEIPIEEPLVDISQPIIKDSTSSSSTTTFDPNLLNVEAIPPPPPAASIDQSSMHADVEDIHPPPPPASIDQSSMHDDVAAILPPPPAFIDQSSMHDDVEANPPPPASIESSMHLEAIHPPDLSPPHASIESSMHGDVDAVIPSSSLESTLHVESVPSPTSLEIKHGDQEMINPINVGDKSVGHDTNELLLKDDKGDIEEKKKKNDELKDVSEEISRK